jgi:hypothetical protein
VDHCSLFSSSDAPQPTASHLKARRFCCLRLFTLRLDNGLTLINHEKAFAQSPQQ